MLHTWNRAEDYRDLAEECRRLAETAFSTRMRHRFWRMAEYYSTLAEAEGPAAHQSTAIGCFNRADNRQTVEDKAADRNSDRESHKENDAEPGSQPISLLSFLEAENMRLRQAILELSLDVSALRKTLKIMEAPTASRPNLSIEVAADTQTGIETLNHPLPTSDRR